MLEPEAPVADKFAVEPEQIDFGGTLGGEGTVNLGEFEKASEVDTQVPVPTFMVYDVPSVIPEITPPAPTVGPEGENV